MNETFKNILNITHYHNNFSEEHIDLLIENSFLSDYVRAMLASSLANQCKVNVTDPRFDEGYEYVRMLEREIIHMLNKIFKMKHMELRFPSGSIAKTALLQSLLEPGDVLIGPSDRFVNRSSSLFSLYRCQGIPLQNNGSLPDLLALKTLLEKEHPKLLFLGTEPQLFEWPLREIAELCHQYNTLLVYDLSAILGLVIAKSFQWDLFQFCDVLVSSTGGSAHAPERGLLLFNDSKQLDLIYQKANFFKNQDNLPNELSGLGVAIAELLEFGVDYAQKAILNARVLAKALANHGLTVLFKEQGYTQNHMLLIEHPETKAAVNALGRAGILSSGYQLIGQEDKRISCIRIGTHILTRRGMGPEQMTIIASAIHRVLLMGEVPEVINNQLIRPLAKQFTQVEFSYDALFPVREEWKSRPYEALQELSTLDALKITRAFSKVSIELLNELEPYFNRLNISDKKVIFKKGDTSDALYFVAQGHIEIYDPDQNDKRIIVHLTSDHFGEYGALTHAPRRFSSRALGDAILLKISIDNFNSLVFALPEVKHYFEKYIQALPSMH